jgi:hypothetical protein
LPADLTVVWLRRQQAISISGEDAHSVGLVRSGCVGAVVSDRGDQTPGGAAGSARPPQRSRRLKQVGSEVDTMVIHPEEEAAPVHEDD